MKTGVYWIRNLVNNKLYIGSASRCLRNRWATHKSMLNDDKHQSRYLQRAWHKYGPDAFVFEALIDCAPGHCLEFEQLMLDVCQPEYNMSPTAGNNLGCKHSTQTKDKMSRSHRGHKVTVNTKHKIRLAQQGSKGNNAKLTEELVQEIRSRLVVGGNQTMIASEYGVSTPTITDIKNRKSWRHV